MCVEFPDTIQGMPGILEKINQSALRFLEPLTLEQTYSSIVEEAVRLIHGVDGLVLLAEPPTNELRLVYSSSRLPETTRPRKNGWAYISFNKRVAFAIGVDKFATIYPNIAKRGIKTCLFIPLFYHRKSLGTLIVRTKGQKELPVVELDLLKVFGSMANLAIRKAQLNSETKTALKTRDLFMSMAAHELKTPLTSIGGYIQLLQSKVKNSEAIEDRWIDHLASENQRLQKLVNELLQTNNIKSGRLQYVWKECSLRFILRQAIENYQTSSPHRQVFFEDLSPTVHDGIIGDFDKLRQVFMSLLSNADKFSLPDSAITIRFLYRRQYFIVQVCDKGKGIPKKELPYVFDEFYKGNSSTEYQGMGLGLFLVKNIIKEHHGKITVASSKKRGTCVEVCLRKATYD